jgi:hypothetical protein
LNFAVANWRVIIGGTGGSMDVRWCVLLALVAGPVPAQQVYKCVDGKKVSYQSDPCTGKTEKAWDATPERFDPDKAAQVEAARRQIQARNTPRQNYGGNSSGPVGARVSISADDAKCEAAKRRRDQALKAAGHRRTFELSRRLDDQVYSACK